MNLEKRHFTKIAEELDIHLEQVKATAELLAEGATIPFIARYRKEWTGSLDELAIMKIRDRLNQLEELEKRRDSILKSLEERELLTEDLKVAIENAEELTTLEDIYLPYRPKRRTRATIAKERGLEPLAEFLWQQGDEHPETIALQYVIEEKEVLSTDDALAGARDIMAEWINEDADARADLRKLFQKEALIESHVIRGKEEEGEKYRDYFEYTEPLRKAPSHRILAMRRGEKEGFLSLKLQPEAEKGIELLRRRFLKSNSLCADQVGLALVDSHKRLLSPSLETEIRLESKQRADEEAIRIFAENLRELLLHPPLGEKPILAIDPGFRTGCKVACLDKQGTLLDHTTIFPHSKNFRDAHEATQIILKLVEEYKPEVIAIGNGTAGRETQQFIESIDLGKKITVIMVNESGASIYSASDVARDEFPEYDVTVRGTVSIGRRLMDPLAELVKIDPKSIGVGQYQHDVDQKALKQSLDEVVMSCVNAVGVDINTASPQLLAYVSGVGPRLAQNIITYRSENGAFLSRKQLSDVHGLGPKAFEQAAGFLRIRNGKNPLDSSAVHPESYGIVAKMAADLKCQVDDLIKDVAERSKIKLENYVTDTFGMPTLKDIMQELEKPGRDPRSSFEIFQFAEGVNSIEDLKVGMVLPGIITNVTAFGAFVDIGVHRDGLVHVSQLADRYVKDPAEIVKVGQKVKVRVTEVDIKRGRISLSMKQG
ncbi:RNA-binding transcriptional accessory protein [bacterium]|nr:RNA-binding transcriptional accessory protein [bacterium]